MIKRPWMVIILLGCLALGGLSTSGRQIRGGLAFSDLPAQQAPLAIEGQIAYIATDGNLWVLRQGENVPLPVTSDANPERAYLSPRWSPDGSLLAFCRKDGGEAGKTGLYFARTGEWQPFLLAEDIYCTDWPEGSFTWSPDNRRIVYARNFNYNPQPGAGLWDIYSGLWAVDLLTNEASELLPPANGNPMVHPQWSPDGKWIKFYEVAYIEGLGVLHTWEVATGRLVNWISLGVDIFPGFSSWSADGARVVFDVVSYTGFPGAGIYSANPDGSDMQTIFAESNLVATHPKHSPRGDRIEFLVNEYGRSTSTLITYALADGSYQEVASSEAGLLALDWSPTGNKLLYALPAGETTDLLVFDVDSGAYTMLAQARLPQADWGPYSAGSVTRESMRPQVIPDINYRPNLMIYLAEDYRLVLFDPAKERQVNLTPPMTVGAYQASPSRRGLVYRDRWLWLNFEAGSNLSIQGTLLPSAPAPGQISWSPNEDRLAMLDAQGKVWLATQGGAYVEIPGAASLPVWSFDGQWLSYCNTESALWLAGPGAPPKQIAENVECPARWSTRGYSLAYTVVGSAAAAPQVYYYDPISGAATFVTEGARLIDWSPDGRLLALIRPDATPGRQIVFSIEPLSGKQLLVGRFLENEAGRINWFPQSGNYLFGPFRLTPDLSSASRVSDAVFAGTAQSGRLVIGIGTSEVITLSCLEPFSGQAQRLATANLANFQPGALNGIWAELSSDGEWAAAYAYDHGRYQSVLIRCDGTAQRAVGLPVTAVPGEFSPNSLWYLERQVVGGASQLVVHDLSQNITKTLPTADHKLGLWIKPLQGVPPGGFSLSGRLTGKGKRPLDGATLLLDGLPAATSAEDGRYQITGLPPGEYTLSPQSDEFYFEPSDVLVRLPSEEVEFEFSGSPIEAGAPPVVQQQENIPDEAEQGFPPAETVGGNPFILIPWICGGSLVLLVFMLFGGVIWLIRRWRRRRAVIASAPAGPTLEDTSPVKVQPVEALPVKPQMPGLGRVTPQEPKSVPQEVATEESLQALLAEGIQMVRQGELARGAETLQKVVEAEEKNATAWMWLGWAAAKSGDRPLAGRCFRQAQQLGHPRAEQALTWLRKTG